jgi:hypothetical protein
MRSLIPHGEKGNFSWELDIEAIKEYRKKPTKVIGEKRALGVKMEKGMCWELSPPRSRL